MAKQKKLPKPNEEISTGIISMHPRGFGFVKLDIPSDNEDVFIPKHLTLHAVDGDHVEIAIYPVISEKGPEGKVVTILSRSRTHVAGIIHTISPFGEILAHVPLLGTSQRIRVKENEAFKLKEGDRVVMEVLEWGSKSNDTLCAVSHYLGHIEDPSCDIEAAIEEYELRKEFPSAVIKEAQAFGTRVSNSEISQRRDLRDLECFTIDPTTAKDFDDALTLSKDKKGKYHLIVHIADVSHYVKEGSALDIEALKRCNSTYFPGNCLPMLPKELSEKLCSLRADVNRLTISVAMDFDPTGKLLSYEIFRSVIKSSKRFTYVEAKEVLDGKKKSKHAPTLNLMVELCHVLKNKRFERGSIEFSLPDLVIKVNSKGEPLDTEYVAYDITHQMVEEFMLKANETIALHLDKEGKSLPYRIHEEPAEENMKDFALLANSFGFDLPEKPKPKQLQMLFDEALQTSYGQYLAVSYIRRMRQALYSPENIGHYGLGLTHYCHFTSPIRRYVDLAIHRTLFSDSLDNKKLTLLTKLCSDQERISAKAENGVSLLKKLRLLAKFHKENPKRQYEAVVTRVKNFGFSFEVLEFLLEGFLHVSDLNQDYFVFDDKRLQLCGKRTGKVYSSGERIQVMLKNVNFILLESKWHLVGSSSDRHSHKQERQRDRNKDRRRDRDKDKDKGKVRITKSSKGKCKEEIKVKKPAFVKSRIKNEVPKKDITKKEVQKKETSKKETPKKETPKPRATSTTKRMKAEKTKTESKAQTNLSKAKKVKNEKSKQKESKIQSKNKSQ